jgi:chromosome segregation ATPase
MENQEVVENPKASEPVVEAGTEQAVKTDNASVQASKDSSTVPATEAKTETQPEIDYRKSYDELRPQFTKTTQELSRLKREYGMTTKELQSLKQAQEQFAKQLAAATEKPIDPAQFIQDLQTQGPKAFDNYLKKHLDSLRSDYQTSYEKVANQNQVLEANLEVMKRERDSKNYPNFGDLKEEMQALADSGKVPDEVFTKPVGEVYDYLYNLVKSQHSEEAIKKAEEFGKNKAEAAIAKESATTVASGGNGDVTIANPSKMNAAQLRKHFIAQGMVSDE